MTLRLRPVFIPIICIRNSGPDGMLNYGIASLEKYYKTVQGQRCHLSKVFTFLEKVTPFHVCRLVAHDRMGKSTKTRYPQETLIKVFLTCGEEEE